MRRLPPLFLLLILLATACSAALTFAAETSPTQGARAPQFELNTLDGGRLALDDFRGEVVLLNFWATWCGPCRLEMPAMQQRYEETGLNILAINFDEPPDLVQAFVDELQLTFPILMDPGGLIQQLYQVRGYPTSYFVDEEGVIRIIHIGFMNEEQLDGYLAEMGVLK